MCAVLPTWWLLSCGICCGPQLQIPDWVDIVKTGRFKELPPQDKDWYYIRAGACGAAAVLKGGRPVRASHTQEASTGSSNRSSSKSARDAAAAAGALARAMVQQQLLRSGLIDQQQSLAPHTGRDGRLPHCRCHVLAGDLLDVWRTLPADVTQVTSEHMPTAVRQAPVKQWLVVAGWPCQDFSLAGRSHDQQPQPTGGDLGQQPRRDHWAHSTLQLLCVVHDATAASG
jgi:ribosomal protein S19E (S16A)